MWGCNAVMGRLAVGHVSPMVIVTLRWGIVCAILVVLARRGQLAELYALRRHWLLIAAMGIAGYTGFNASFYAAAHFTTAVNIAIIQGAIPIFVLIGAALLYRMPIRLAQAMGVVTTLLGVALVATEGQLQQLVAVRVNVGDGLMLAACFLYALYTLGLRRRPAVSAIGFFTAMALVAAITSLPLLAIEVAYGQPQWPTPFGWLLVVLIAVGPSLLSQLMFMRGVEQIGPARAGMFVNLVPIFGAFLAVLILGEKFAWHHGAALGLVLGGILLAERGAMVRRP